MGENEPSGDPIDWVERMRDLRRLMGWSQRKLAKELRVTPGAVSQWESRQRAIPGPVKRLLEIYERELGMIDPPREAGLSKINATWVYRAMRASTTTAKMVARLAGSSVRSLVVGDARATEIKHATQVAMAQDLVETLGELKGLPMKLGQMVSHLDFAASEHVRAAFQTLQDSTPPLSAQAVEGVFLDSLRDRPERIFDSWDPRPIAAASIGQVHRARLADGTDVAVKVQYPGIRSALESDFKNLVALEKLATLLGGSNPKELLGELRERILEECDYRREAANQEDFRRIHAGAPGIVVPRVHRRFSSDRVLTMDYVDGRSFAAFVQEADQQAKDRAGELIFRMSSESLFRHGIFNADPHPGNYVFLATGDVAFLDFGCVKRFRREVLRSWAEYALCVLENRRAEADRLFVKQGFVEDPDRFDFDYHHQSVLEILEPMSSKTPFRFNRHFVERNWKTTVVQNPNKNRMRMPPDFLFMNRVQWGLHSVLAALEARANWGPLLRASLKACVDATS
jgi:predicted unusual protein kinase regulating ubiquinone biosynthesis (AarF/ABC1/UbiB family)